MPSETIVSEQRLHPLSPLFALAAQAKSLLLPGVLALVAARSSDGNWEVWAMFLLVPYFGYALITYATYRWRCEEEKLVIRTGLLFRSERQIPFHRIQNVDAIQGVFHRLARVVEVRLETGGGDEPEARIRVLSVAAYQDLRARVRAAAPGMRAPSAATSPADGEEHELLRLPTREVLLLGWIENRGGVILAAGLGLLWELGLLEPLTERIGGAGTTTRGFVTGLGREVARAFFDSGTWPLQEMGYALAGFLALLFVLRIASMGLAWLRWGGFRLTGSGADLHVDFGRLTRVHATVPRRRIQAVTVHSWPTHRLFARASLRVVTAAANAKELEEESPSGERLAPILPAIAIGSLLTRVLPELAWQGHSWQRVEPRAFRRAVKKHLLWIVPFAGLSALEWGAWAVPFLVGLVAWAAYATRKQLAALGWALAPGALWIRKGWLWRTLHIVPLSKIQAAGTSESPFDRRAGMATLRVDIAGGGLFAFAIRVPYLARDTASELCRRLAEHAARTELSW